MKKLLSLFAALALLAFSAGAQTLEVSTDNIELTGVFGQTVASSTIQVGNAATSGTSYIEISDDADWLSLSASTATATNNQYTNIVFSYVITNLAVGHYDATVTITQTNDDTEATVAVGLDVVPFISRGTVLGNALALKTNSIAIGDKSGLAQATASGAVQIGAGVNPNPNTVQFGSVKAFSNGVLVADAIPGSVVLAGSVNFTGKVFEAVNFQTNSIILTTRSLVVQSNRVISIGALVVTTNSL